MKNEKMKEILQVLCEIAENLVTVREPARQGNSFDGRGLESNDKASLSEKLDLMERVLGALRIKNKQLNNNLAFSDFIQGDLKFENNQIHFTPPIKPRVIGFGTRPVYLQRKLLIYLLYSHGDPDKQVYDIINNFVRVIWDDLDELDFEKTKTGVFRCFTNTRFAANTLRDYGLLKFTKKEAFKTWVLSFTGVMVASKFVRDGTWQKPLFVNKYSTDLHPAIKNSFKELSVLSEFLDTLRFITKSNLNLSEAFTNENERALPLLLQHHTALQDATLSRQEKKTKCKEILNKIETDEAVIKLFENLVSHLKVGELLSIR